MPDRPSNHKVEAPAQAGALFMSARADLVETLRLAGITLSDERLDAAVADFIDMQKKLALVRAAVREASDG